jgi:hypothetical protein
MLRRSFSHWMGIVMLAVTAVGGSGCSALAVRLGLRVPLDTLPVASASASLVSRRDGSKVTALGPGQSARLVIAATTSDGKQFVTVGAGSGKVAFDNYSIEASVVQVSKRGTVSLASDPRVSDGKIGHLRISSMAHPEVVTELDVPARYDLPFVADFSGSSGINGADGTDGIDGMSGAAGTPATVDPTTGVVGNPGTGGSGTNGGNGGDGSNGEAGSPGEDVHAWIRLESGPKPLLQIKVSSGSRRQAFYLVDPNGGSLRIVSNGGAGGRGGHGGRAGRGGSGGSGFPNGTSGMDGIPGMDGLSGSDGLAGAITLSVDPAAQPYMKCISWSNQGRAGTGSGRTTIEPVAALW